MKLALMLSRAQETSLKSNFNLPVQRRHYTGPAGTKAVQVANAIVGVSFGYETMGQANGMIMISISGTAVVIE